MQIEQRGIDKEEEEKVTEFCSKGCGCLMQCSSRLSREHIRLMHVNVAALDRTAPDMTIVSQIMAFTNCSKISLHSSKHCHQRKEREKYNTLCYHQGTRICRKTKWRDSGTCLQLSCISWGAVSSCNTFEDVPPLQVLCSTPRQRHTPGIQ